jgi:hypothetical protein
MVFDFDTRELLRVRPNPLSHDKIVRLRRTGPAAHYRDRRPERARVGVRSCMPGTLLHKPTDHREDR